MIVPTRFRFRRYTSQDWAEQNPILGPGEPGFNLSTGELSIGNGTTRYSDLPRLGATGPPGATGPQGNQGEPGGLGDKGPTGDQGPAGDKGLDGDKGLHGDKGATGDKGPTGDQGPAGNQGAPGATGDKGLTGDKGPTGDQGPVGNQGPPGNQGSVGDKGADGDKGATGDKGPQGDPGSPAACWPVGSVFISVVATNPTTLLGVGTWAGIGTGRVLVGLDSGDPDFDTVEETGGAKTVSSSAQTFGGNALATHQHDAISAGTPAGTITGIVVDAHTAHTHSTPAHAHTLSAHTHQGAAHTHDIAHTHGTSSKVGTSTANIKDAALGTTASGARSASTSGGPSADTTDSSGSGTSGNPSASLTHNVSNNGSFSGSALATHQHAAITAGTPAGTNTPGAATSVIQPYFVVYMWKRTA